MTKWQRRCHKMAAAASLPSRALGRTSASAQPMAVGVALVESRGNPEMDAPSNAPTCLVLAGFCFLLGFASQLLRALAERSEAAWGGRRELADKGVVPPPCRLSDTPAAAHASSKPRSEGRSALTQLRAAGEAAWGGGPMPAALDDEAQTQTPSPNPNP